MRLEVLVGDPGTAADEADVAVTFELKDVRCRTAATPCTDGSPPDYDGELQAIMPMQITDRFNGGLGTQAATAEAPFQSRITIPCFPTGDMTVGSSCLLSTTLDAVVPGQVREGKRAVWGLGSTADRRRGCRRPGLHRRLHAVRRPRSVRLRSGAGAAPPRAARAAAAASR